MNVAQIINIMRTEGTYKSKIPIFLWLICEREEKRENSDTGVFFYAQRLRVVRIIFVRMWGALTEDTHRYLSNR